jgi:hypothetical protein
MTKDGQDAATTTGRAEEKDEVRIDEIGMCIL